jgi:predicted enzyme related to lactoylglutathione lyase
MGVRPELPGRGGGVGAGELRLRQPQHGQRRNRIPGGVGGGTGYEGHVVFYVGVPDVEAALQKAESLGGQRRMGPERAPTGLVVGHFTDPEGNLIGVAGTA